MKFNNNLKEIRHKIREGSFTSTTSGLNPGYTQTNVAILPSQYALDFMIFCQRAEGNDRRWIILDALKRYATISVQRPPSFAPRRR